MARRARRVGRTAGPAIRATLLVAMEAAAFAPKNLGIVVAGSNLQQGASWQAFQKFQAQPAWLSPRHGYEYLDTHVLAAIAEVLAARGPGLTVGGASASGNVAIATAFDLIRNGRAAACLVVGPLPDLSPAEWHALEAIGALADASAPCRPFDRSATGFVPGQACGAILLENASLRDAAPLAEIAGACFVLGASHLPSPDAEGEARAMAGALKDGHAGIDEIDYIGAHATGTPAGDAAECAAIRRFLGDRRQNVPVNATKSLVGHALHAAGIIQLIALVLQMRGGFVHGTAGLADPIDRDLWLLGPKTIERPIRLGLSNAFGFGSIASSVLVRRAEGP
jgi:malonyl-ACP decarboxylase